MQIQAGIFGVGARALAMVFVFQVQTSWLAGAATGV
jgi:hypothetical protein